MDVDHLRELASLERTYWWHVSKRALAVDLLARFAPPPGLLIEGGIGGGYALSTFRDLGYGVVGLDALPEAVEAAKEHGVDDVRVCDLDGEWGLVPGSARVVVARWGHFCSPQIAVVNSRPLVDILFFVVVHPKLTL